MPSIDQSGIGPCVHKYVDGRCWFCGQDETKPDGELMRKLQGFLDKVNEDTPTEAYLNESRTIREELKRAKRAVFELE